MKLNIIKPRGKLKKLLKIKPQRDKIELFKTNLVNLFSQIDESESEEFHKNIISKFLDTTYYSPNYYINTKGRNDLVIHNGKNAESKVGVIIEAKKPTNKLEMLSKDNLNTKAFHELLLYYLRERITDGNLEIKHLIATNTYEWFIFDAHLFEKEFAQNKKLVKQFQDFEEKRLSGEKTDFFYKEIAEPTIKAIKSEVTFTYFDIRDYKKFIIKDDKKLIALYKIFSPEHLLKLPFVNDSNSLDKSFYTELLHIIGLAEIKKGSKKLIERKSEKEQNAGSLLENAILKLDSLDKIQRLKNKNIHGDTHDEKLFHVALELSITWINRILFLKLLEAQIITYHKGDKDFSFFNLKKVRNFDDLDDLFFAVLAKIPSDRNKDVKEKFANVPYLNSSLFEPTEIEQETIFISNLGDDKTLPILTTTVLKNSKGKKRKGKLNTLEYLFEFLNAYDFTSEGVEDIQEESKTLINASVLGLIFEKINGYKDGSFFTPGFITMYMCRETIRRAVIQKFNNYLEILSTNETGDSTKFLKAPLSKGTGDSTKLSKAPLSRGAGGVSKRRTIIPYNPKLKEIARKLRNNSTKSEIHLWKYLKGKFQGKYDFHRQKPLDNYIADFFCSELHLVIEIDGITHEWEKTKKNDLEKEKRLNELGLHVLRFTDEQVLENTDGVIQLIIEYVSCFENNDFSFFNYENTPLNPLSRGDLMENFRDQKKKFNSLDDIYESIGDNNLFSKQEANEIINSLKICDPAVGSGHFLVSALNEIIAIKSELQILLDRGGKTLRDYTIEIVNDELIITDDDGDLFEYYFKNKEKQRVQEALFHEKQTIIENCLFGVDINHNSVKICRLRLWIELLKNSYYKKPDFKELETLPNIDINIKCGNSLISRFPLDADIKKALEKSNWTIDSYKDAVMNYRNAQNKEQKRKMVQLIADIKSDFRTTLNRQGKEWKKLETLKGELYNLLNQIELLELSDAKKKSNKVKEVKLEKAISKQTAVIEAIESSKIYENAFEWRFEFPEVLNDDGDFVGFDLVIGNPPYMSHDKIENKELIKLSYSVYEPFTDIYSFFYELAISVICKSGELAFITSNSFLKAEYGDPLRKYFINQGEIISIINLEEVQIFQDATVNTCLLFFNKSKQGKNVQIVNSVYKLQDNFIEFIDLNLFYYTQEDLQIQTWNLPKPHILNVGKKIKGNHKTLNNYKTQINLGIATGANDIFILNRETYSKLINEDSKNINILKPLLRGRDIQRYHYVIPDLKIILSRNEVDVVKEYPVIFDYLDNAGDSFKKRGAKGKHWTNLRACSFFDDFKKEKIVWIELSDLNKFALSTEEIYLLNSAYFLIPPREFSSKFLLSILNSKVINFYLKLIANTSGVGTTRWINIYVKEFPVPELNKNSQKPFIKLVDKILEIKKADRDADTSALEKEIDNLVYKLYDLTEEEIEIIENS